MNCTGVDGVDCRLHRFTVANYISYKTQLRKMHMSRLCRVLCAAGVIKLQANGGVSS